MPLKYMVMHETMTDKKNKKYLPPGRTSASLTPGRGPSAVTKVMAGQGGETLVAAGGTAKVQAERLSSMLVRPRRERCFDKKPQVILSRR